MSSFTSKRAKAEKDYEAPDKSEIRLLTEVKGSSVAQVTLRPRMNSEAKVHRTVDEQWYFIQGIGQLWRQEAEFSEVIDVRPGIAITIPKGVSFQFLTQDGSLYPSFASIILSDLHMAKKQRMRRYPFLEYGNTQTGNVGRVLQKESNKGSSQSGSELMLLKGISLLVLAYDHNQISFQQRDMIEICGNLRFHDQVARWQSRESTQYLTISPPTLPWFGPRIFMFWRYWKEQRILMTFCMYFVLNFE